MKVWGPLLKTIMRSQDLYYWHHCGVWGAFCFNKDLHSLLNVSYLCPAIQTHLPWSLDWNKWMPTDESYLYWNYFFFPHILFNRYNLLLYNLGLRTFLCNDWNLYCIPELKSIVPFNALLPIADGAFKDC